MANQNTKSEKDSPGLAWFERYCDDLDNRSIVEPPVEATRYRCPCCRYRTLEERGGFDICPVCFWEDDGQDDQDADIIRGGPNGSLSLSQARSNFKEIGVSEQRFIGNVRKPNADEE
jgi:hypothetical protein